MAVHVNFFILASASLVLDLLLTLGWSGVVLVLLRIVAQLIGGYVGAQVARVPAGEAKWYGPALLPQASVAVGMALVAGEQFPQCPPTIMALTIATTVILEILGPPITLIAIRRVEST